MLPFPRSDVLLTHKGNPYLNHQHSNDTRRHSQHTRLRLPYAARLLRRHHTIGLIHLCLDLANDTRNGLNFFLIETLDICEHRIVPVTRVNSRGHGSDLSLAKLTTEVW